MTPLKESCETFLFLVKAHNSERERPSSDDSVSRCYVYSVDKARFGLANCCEAFADSCLFAPVNYAGLEAFSAKLKELQPLLFRTDSVEHMKLAKGKLFELLRFLESSLDLEKNRFSFSNEFDLLSAFYVPGESARAQRVMLWESVRVLSLRLQKRVAELTKTAERT